MIPHPRLKRIRQATNEFLCEHAVYGVALRLTECLPSIRSRIICEKRSRNRQSTDTQDKHDLFCSSLIQVNKRRS